MARVVQRHHNPLKRAISEKVAIEIGMKVGALMNSKNEWGGQPLPRIMLETVEVAEDVNELEEIKAGVADKTANGSNKKRKWVVNSSNGQPKH